MPATIWCKHCKKEVEIREYAYMSYNNLADSAKFCPLCGASVICPVCHVSYIICECEKER